MPSHFEGLHEPLGWRHFAVAALEAVYAIGAVLDESPVAAALDLHALDHEFVAASPPLREQLGIGEGPPDPLDRCVEDSFDADLAIAGRADRRCCVLD
jgi:hypothetical protein